MILNILYNSLIGYLLFNAVFYITNGILFLIDYYRVLINYKIQSTDPIITYKKCIPTVLCNTLLCTIPLSLIFGFYETAYTLDFVFRNLVMEIVISRIFTEILFYGIHRIFHLKGLYQLIHKKHHEIIAPVGISAVYMTPIDFYIGNVLPIYLPMFILQAHPFTIKIWSIITIVNAVVSGHSGFKYISEGHDYHHSLFNKNFGTDLFMDRLFGTFVK